jgi:hypothetical protein
MSQSDFRVVISGIQPQGRALDPLSAASRGVLNRLLSDGHFKSSAFRATMRTFIIGKTAFHDSFNREKQFSFRSALSRK